MLTQLDIPMWKGDNIYMDFVIHLLRIMRKNDLVCDIVDN